MKIFLVALLLAIIAVPAHAQKPQHGKHYPQDEPTATGELKQPVAVESDFRETLSKATLAIYAGKQACEYVTISTFFGDFPEWTCGFESHFVCTGTVIHATEGTYVGLTAGHCFSYDRMDEGYKYYISDGVNAHPVLREIEILKFESNDQYDYGVFSFDSLRDYPAVSVSHGPVPALGTRVLNVNFSLGVVKEVVEGPVVSNQISEVESTRAPHLRRRYMVQIPFGPGASGSPIVDEESHEIVGLVEAAFPSTQMAAVVMPVGPNFGDFLEDDSVGLKPLPEPKNTNPDADQSLMDRVRSLYDYFFHKDQKAWQ